MPRDAYWNGRSMRIEITSSTCGDLRDFDQVHHRIASPRRRTMYKVLLAPALAVHLLCSTFIVSSSLSNSPRFRISPAFGASSREYAAIFFRYAVWRAFVLAA